MTGKDDGLDEIRATVMSKLRERGLSLKEISEAVGKNVTYMQQFVRKGSPRVLPDDVRAIVSKVLDIPAEFLAGGESRPYSTESGLANSSNQNRQTPSGSMLSPSFGPRSPPCYDLCRGQNLIPVFTCDDLIDAAQARDWVERPGGYAGSGQAFAVWITHSIGRLQVGDLAFVRPNQPAATGDLVVVVKEQRLVAVGMLKERGEWAAVVHTGNAETSCSPVEHKLMRIVAAVFK